ncbi:MAG: T9SS type A sorting domain-containing protein, partial [Paludibacter sp.]|nr:T9SS type A sorting domain-containing protein [Paludibacter sp.]
LSGGGRAWWYLSSPLAAASSSIFGSDKVGKHVEDYESDGNPATTAPYYSSPFSTPETLTPGYGYILKRTSPADNATYTFTGSALNSGTISPTVTCTGTTAGARGFNLVGNPYPSYIDWDAVYADATHLRNALWFRTYSGGQMVFHTYGDGDAVPEITSSTIAPMQAFWVKVDADGNTGTLTFKNTHRSHFTSGANPLKVTANDNRQRIRLVISNGTANDETLLVGKSYAQDNRDNYDIEKMSNENSEIPEIFSIVGNEELVINAMQAINEGKTFSLGIRPGQAGSYTIKATQLENISGHVVLVDRLTGTETELTESSSYSFNSDGTATNDRFSVEVRAPGALTSTETTSIKKLRIDRLNNCILIRGTKAGEQVGIFNTMGQLLQSFTASGDRTELQHNFSPGIYLIKANQQSGKFTLK